MSETTPVVMGSWGPWLGIDPVTKKRTAKTVTAWYRAGDAERAVVFRPGYRTDRKSYGQHGMEITWLLRGPNGVIQFEMFTGWVPGLDRHADHLVHAPMGADLGYHTRFPQYDGQDAMTETCDYLDGPCYYDGSGLMADDLLREFLIHGEQVIWDRLAERHDALQSESGRYPSNEETAE